MEENKNIDKFFKDRLEVDDAQDWAIPSDDIWMTAKSRFVEKEKRKKGFIFWLFGSGLVIISLVILGSIFYNNKNENITVNQYANEIEQVENNKLEDFEIEVSTKDFINTTATEQPVNANPSKGREARNLETSKSKNANSADDSQAKIRDNKTELASEANIEVKDLDLVNASRIKEVSNVKNRSVYNKISGSESSELIERSLSELNEPKSSLVTDEIDKTLPQLELMPNHIGLIKTSKSESANYDLMAGLSVVTSPLILDRPNYELGLSHSKFLISAVLNADVIEDEEAELNNIKFSIYNITITGRKWINRNWSYSIGANFSQLDINTDIDLLDTLDRNLNNFINDKYAISRSNLKSEVPDIGLIDGVELNVGDILNVRGNVDLSLRAVQIPVLIDYHIYKGKMEYLLGTGFSMDFLEVAQDEIDISIYKDQQLINKPFVQERVSEFLFDYSIYADLGMKYHVHKNLNAGLSMKISILDPVFSYAELGVYYRWHK